MYQAFEDYACPTQFPVILKTDEKRLVSSYIVFWVLRDYFPFLCMTTPPKKIVKSRCVVIFRCVVIAPPLPHFPPTKSQRGTHTIKRAPLALISGVLHMRRLAGTQYLKNVCFCSSGCQIL